MSSHKYRNTHKSPQEHPAAMRQMHLRGQIPTLEDAKCGFEGQGDI